MTEPTAYDQLPDKQRRFVDAYLESLCAAKAAEAARYAHPAQAGHRLRHLPHVAAAISEQLAKRAMPRDEVLARLADIGRGSLGDFIEVLPNGKWRLDLTKAEKAGKLHLLHEVSETEYGPKIKLHDPMGALSILAKHHGLAAPEKHEVTIHDDGADREFDRKLAGVIALVTAGADPSASDGG